MALSIKPKLSDMMSLTVVLLLAMSTTTCLGRRPLASTTHLILYVHDITGGQNPTNVAVAGIHGKHWSIKQFGTLFSIDDHVTAGPHLDSAPVGRLQGMSLTGDLRGRNVFLQSSIVFTNKEYNGSALELQGASIDQIREVAIVSGSGKFRFARGYVTFQTHYVNSSIGYAVKKANVTVRHY